MQFVILAETRHKKAILERRSQDVELAPEAPCANALSWVGGGTNILYKRYTLCLLGSRWYCSGQVPILSASNNRRLEHRATLW